MSSFYIKKSNYGGVFIVKFKKVSSLAPPFGGAERISGIDRYQASARMADRTEEKNVVLVNGSDFVDALSAVNIANAREADVVLAPKKVYSNITEICSGSGETFIAGGNLSVTSNMIDIAIDDVDPTPVRNIVARLDKVQIEKEGEKYFIRDLYRDDYVTNNNLHSENLGK